MSTLATGATLSSLIGAKPSLFALSDANGVKRRIATQHLTLRRIGRPATVPQIQQITPIRYSIVIGNEQLGFLIVAVP